MPSLKGGRRLSLPAELLKGNGILLKWNPDYEKMGKGVTMSEEEMQALRDLLDAEIPRQ
jgi:hypothetical protein